ncbi:hypothetical protein AWB81_08304 [Caballeronia arationis]|jgi:hypothetical protein|nr:hypothetical protein AWB81_08304 [Caballeronia arationis]
MLTAFCRYGRAKYAAAAITSTLTSACPSADKAVPCSLCLRPVDRTASHVAVSRTAFEGVSQPWLISAWVCYERELAVYCSSFAEPRLTSEAALKGQSDIA